MGLGLGFPVEGGLIPPYPLRGPSDLIRRHRESGAALAGHWAVSSCRYRPPSAVSLLAGCRPPSETVNGLWGVFCEAAAQHAVRRAVSRPWAM
jgi:hypothetical protein